MSKDLTPLHDVSLIETPEQVHIALPLAGVGSRGVAFIIDSLFQSVPIFAAMVALMATHPHMFGMSRVFEKQSDGQYVLRSAVSAAMLLVSFVVNFGYFAFFEIIWKGQSPGKRAVGLRVVRDGGYPIDARAALIRNLLRIVDALPTGYALGLATLLISRDGKRLGDYAAGTCVIVEPRSEANDA